MRGILTILVLVLGACAKVPSEHWELVKKVDAEITERLDLWGEPSAVELLSKKHAYRITSAAQFGYFDSITLEVQINGTGKLYLAGGRPHGQLQPTTRTKARLVNAEQIKTFVRIVEMAGFWTKDGRTKNYDACGRIELDLECVIVHADGGPLWLEAVRGPDYQAIADVHLPPYGKLPEFHSGRVEFVVEALQTLAKGGSLDAIIQVLPIHPQ